jgi:hypothetical protein
MPSYAAVNSLPSQHSTSRPSSTSSQSVRARHTKQNGQGGSASWISSVVNLVNTIVGAGVLAMPHAMSNMGITLGVLVILWAGLTSGFGLYLQTRCARYLDRGTSSFFALSQITYPGAAILFDAAIMLKCFGVGVSYLIIIGDLMPGVVRGFVGNVDSALYLVDRQFWVTAFMYVLVTTHGEWVRMLIQKLQAYCDSLVLSAKAGQLKIHFHGRASIHQLLSCTGGLSLCSK